MRHLFAMQLPPTRMSGGGEFVLVAEAMALIGQEWLRLESRIQMPKLNASCPQVAAP